MLRLPTFAMTVLALSTGAAPAQDANEIVYGLVTAYTGAAAPWGRQHDIVVRMAIDRINADGGVMINGIRHPMVLREYDHAYDSNKAVDVVRQAVQADGVRFLEVLDGAIIPAIQPITEPERVIVFALAAGTFFLGEDTPYTFRPYWDDAGEIEAVLDHLAVDNPDRGQLLLLYPDDLLGESNSEEVMAIAAESGFETSTIFLPRDQGDFASVVANVLQFEPDYIDFGVTAPPLYAALAKQLRDRGFEGDFLFSGSLDVGSMREADAMQYIEGALVSHFVEPFTTEEGIAWMNGYREGVGAEPYFAWAVSYDGLMLLEAAIEEANSLDTELVTEALERVTVQGLLGEVHYGGAERFGVNRSLVLPVKIGRVTDGQIVDAEIH